MRGKHPATKTVIFNGIEFRKSPSQNYFVRKLTGRKELRLHREVWAFHNGPIPAGHDVHHKDENTENNDISNLECLTKSDHGHRHKPRRERTCATCGVLFSRKSSRGDYCSLSCGSRSKKRKTLICRWCGVSFETVDAHARYCSAVCGEASRYANRGTPKPCPQCGKQFLAKHKVSKFCSSGCAARHRVEQKRSGIRLEC